MKKNHSLQKASKSAKTKESESKPVKGFYFIDEIFMLMNEQAENETKHEKDEQEAQSHWNEWEDDWIFAGDSDEDRSAEAERKKGGKRKESSSSSPYAVGEERESGFQPTESEWEELPQSFDELARLDSIRAARKRKKRSTRKKR